MADSTRSIPTEHGSGGQIYGQTFHSPVDNHVRAQMQVPSLHVIPIVFIPGIMGSNLVAKVDIKDSKNKKVASKGDEIWNVDSLTSPLSTWFGGSINKRQLLLNKDVVEVNKSGNIAQGKDYIATPYGGVAVPTGRTPISNLSLQVVRARGWGEVSWYSYGPFLDWLQSKLKDGGLSDGKPNNVLQELYELAGTTPKGAMKVPAPLTQGGIKKLLQFQFPVHALGYNWLQSNMQSGLDIKNRIVNEIIPLYNKIRGQHCDQVILITHSMGGLVARAATEVHGAPVLGVIHGEQPIDGAAAFYKRLAAGFSGEGSGLGGEISGWVTGMTLGPNAEATIPMIAYNPGPLELAPNKLYNGGRPWLFIKDEKGRDLKKLPEKGDPYKEIYLNTTAAWRAVNPSWLNPAAIPGDPVAKFIESVKTASEYHRLLAGKLHNNTYAHFGADRSQEAWGSVIWVAVGGSTYTPGFWERTSAAMGGMPSLPQWIPSPNIPLGKPEEWKFQTNLSGDSKRQFTGAKGEVHMTVQGPGDIGDGTVPAAASGERISIYAGCQVACKLNGFDHQGSYGNSSVRRVVMDAVIRIIAPVNVVQ